MSTQTTSAGLEPYREQARELQDALAKVKDIQAQTAAVTLQRDNVLQQRQSLLDSFEDESAVAELSKLGSRVEMCEAKLASLAGKLASAESDLKQVLETFGTSFRNLHSQLSTFLFTAALEHLTSLVHPELRVRSKSACAEVAWLDERVVEVQPLRIPTLTDYFQSIPPQAEVLRVAGLSLEKSEALLAEAAKHPGFVPPQPAQAESASLAAAA